MSRRTGFLARPWFWFLLIGGLWIIPLVKSLGAELPVPLPGIEGEPLVLRLPAERGGEVAFSDLGGSLLILRELPLADRADSLRTLDRLHELRARLRGLGSAVVFLMIASGGSPEELTALLDERTVRKPVHAFLHDAGGERWDALCRRAEADTGTESLLLDRHGRLRGFYAADVAGVDGLVRDAGQLANWPASDPPPGQGVPTR